MIQHWDMSELVGRARDAIIERIRAIKEARPAEEISTIYLSLPCSFFMLKTQRLVTGQTS